jgi:hypothetical protein
VKSRAAICVLFACSTTMPAHAQSAPVDGSAHGAYLSLGFGDGRIQGGNQDAPDASRSLAGRAFEARVGREEAFGAGAGRIDFIHYNEGHPDNNHRDGFALQWVALPPLGSIMGGKFSGKLSGELGAGPYLSMNTTAIDGREVDDARWGLLFSAALRLPLAMLPSGAHLRVGLNYVLMPGAHRSTAVLFGIGRQFGPARPAPTEPIAGPWWFGASVGKSITNLSGAASANAGVLEARRWLDGRLEHWAVSAKLVDEGDDGARVDRRGIAGQLWYVQQVTPGFTMSAGAGPYLARNFREADKETRGHLLVSLQAERALSGRSRVFINVNRIKTFLQTDDRDLLQIGLLQRF